MRPRPLRLAAALRRATSAVAVLALVPVTAVAAIGCSDDERAPAIDPIPPRLDGGGSGDGAVRPDTGTLDSGAKPDSEPEASPDAADAPDDAADVSVEDAADAGG